MLPWVFKTFLTFLFYIYFYSDDPLDSGVEYTDLKKN